MLPLLLSSFLSAAIAAQAAPSPNFINTGIARTIELGGATTSITTQYNIKSLKDGPGDYWLALAGTDGAVPAWWEVTIGGKPVAGVGSSAPSISEGAPTIAVPLGNLKKDESITLSVSHDLIHASVPLPAEIAQRDPQYLLWTTNSTYVDSWYPTDSERIKIRTPTPNILSYGEIPNTYARDNTVTKSASTITLGPFSSLPATLGEKATAQVPFKIHFETREPIMGLKKLLRSAEVSHWGGNLNIQDEVSLVNNGPKLKGHFSRLAHQQSKYHASTPAQILTDVTLRLPPTAHTPYYYDIIGNVSTSKFRPGSTPASMASSKSKIRTSPRTVEAILELKPRYPILGGWQYNFTVGWDMPLGDALRSEEKGNKMVLSVPMLTGWRDLAVDEVEMRIVLPEGAREVEVFTPFPVDDIVHSIHKTYLDSTGRYAITIYKAHCTERHAQPILVTYTYPSSALWQKPLTVSAVVMGLFILGMGLRRVEWSIEAKKVL